MKTGKGVNARTEGSVAGKRGREPNIPVVVVVVVVRWKSRWWRPPVWLIFYYPTPEPPTPPLSIRFTPRATIIRAVSFSWRGQWRRKRGNERKSVVGRGKGKFEGSVAEGLRWPDARWKRPQRSFRSDDAGCITGFQRTFVRYFRDRHSKRHVFFLEK